MGLNVRIIPIWYWSLSLFNSESIIFCCGFGWVVIRKVLVPSLLSPLPATRCHLRLRATVRLQNSRIDQNHYRSVRKHNVRERERERERYTHPPLFFRSDSSYTRHHNLLQKLFFAAVLKRNSIVSLVIPRIR